MGHPQALTLWLLQRIEHLNAKIHQLRWIEEFNSQLTDVLMQVTIDGREFSGWGCGESEDLALTKAAAEIMERLILQEHKFPTSNGLAAHSTLERAKQAAINELRERDLLLCHFYTRTPLPSPRNEFLHSAGLFHLAEWFVRRRIILNLHPLGESGFLAVLDGRSAEHPFGYIIGSAIKETHLDSARSATIEAARAGHRLIHEDMPIPNLSLPQFLDLQRPRFTDHGALAQNLDYAETISWLFQSNTSKTPDNADIPVSVAEVSNPHRQFADCPLKFARATSDSLQDLFVGSPTMANINLERMSQFSRRNIQWDDIPAIPHPLA